MAYATSAELASSDFLPADLDVPTDVDRLLSRASRAVDRLLLLASCVYAVDDDGLPTDDRVVAALRDATCAQAAWWIETGDEAGTASVVQSASSGGGPSSSGPMPRWAPDAVDVIRTAVDTSGCPLMSGPVWL